MALLTIFQLYHGYLVLLVRMSPLNAASCTKPISKDKNVMVQTRKHYFKKTLFDLEVKGQGPRKVIMVHDTGCMSIRWCVAYHNDLCWTLTFDLMVK
jgi:hypothetical protein